MHKARVQAVIWGREAVDESRDRKRRRMRALPSQRRERDARAPGEAVPADRARPRERERCKPLAGGCELLRQRCADALEQLADLGV